MVIHICLPINLSQKGMVHLFLGYLSNLESNEHLDASDIFLVCLNKNELHESVDFSCVSKICLDYCFILRCNVLSTSKNALHEGSNFSCLY